MTKKAKKGVMRGIKITNIRSLGGMYDNTPLSVSVDIDDGEEYCMLASEVLRMASEFVFTLEKKRRYTYLTVDWDKTLELRQEEGR